MSFNSEVLAAMKTTYLAWVQAGCPQSYAINGRSVTKADMDKIFERIKELEGDALREENGSFFLSTFQDPE